MPEKQRRDRVLAGGLILSAGLAGGYVCALVTLTIGAGSSLAYHLALAATLAVVSLLARRFFRRRAPSDPCRTLVATTRGLPAPWRYAGAAFLLVLALLLDRFLDGDPAGWQLSTFVLPAMLATILFDLRPGLFAVALNAAAVNCLLIPAQEGLLVSHATDAGDFLAFVLMMTLLAFAVQMLMDARAGRRQAAAPAADFTLPDWVLRNEAPPAALPRR